MKLRHVIGLLLVLVAVFSMAFIPFQSGTGTTTTILLTETETQYLQPVNVQYDQIGLPPGNYTWQPGQNPYFAASTTRTCSSGWFPLQCYAYTHTNSNVCIALCPTTTISGSSTSSWCGPLCQFNKAKTTTTTSSTTTSAHPNATIAVILAEFSDVKHNRTLQSIEDQWNTQFVAYWGDVSHDNIHPWADFYGWVDVGKPLWYYGRDYSGSIDCGFSCGSSGGPISWQLAGDAVAAVENGGNTLSRYTTVFIIHAGDGEESDTHFSDNIWSVYYFNGPRAGGTHGNPPAVGNGYPSYGIMAETERTTPGAVKDPLGVWAHEFFHSLGAPDLYNSNENTNARTGHWELMSLGLWNGAGTSGAPFGGLPSYTLTINQYVHGWIPSAQVRQAFVGSPENFTIQLNPIETFTGLVLARIVLPSGSAYYVEARSQIGFDSYIPENGIIITYAAAGLNSTVYIVNATPADHTLNHAAWQPGQIFTDPGGHVKIKIVSYSSGVWTINILVT